MLHQHVVVLALEAHEALFELLRRAVVARVGVKAPVDEAGDCVLAPVTDAGEGWVVVDERGAREPDAVNVDDNQRRQSGRTGTPSTVGRSYGVLSPLPCMRSNSS